jgi:putative phosphoesterase
MKRIGLISDTHGWLDEAVFSHFSDCDEIWHAGDFGSHEVVKALEAFKPLRGVSGNIDDRTLRCQFPEVLRFRCEEVAVLMIHIGGYPGKYTPLAKRAIMSDAPRLFISGHSHILKIMFDEQYQCLHMNPGAAGKQGWHRVRTLIRFEVDGAEMRNCEVIELGRK